MLLMVCTIERAFCQLWIVVFRVKSIYRFTLILSSQKLLVITEMSFGFTIRRIDLLEKGQSYDALNNTYIIFICTFGVFTGNRHKYTFKNLCLEEQGLSLEDGSTKLFLSTKGTADDISKPLKIFLDYVDGKLPADTLMQEIDAEVNTVRSCDEWRREYMTLALEMDRKYSEGKAEGRIEGKAEGMLRLAVSLWKKGKLTESEAAEEAGVSLDEFQKAVLLMT